MELGSLDHPARSNSSINASRSLPPFFHFKWIASGTNNLPLGLRSHKRRNRFKRAPSEGGGAGLSGGGTTSLAGLTGLPGLSLGDGAATFGGGVA